ncbi:MAG TPA: hypothetical protein VNN80_35960, partial [Polyangiaceae bacterium]|nr:hypothetical protein [Polyangiaceae bacterium]
SVTRSISGHLTEEMQELYESVGEDETCRAVSKVVALVERSRGPDRSGPKSRGAASLGDEPLETLVEQLSQLLVGLREQGKHRRPHEVRDLFEDDAADGEFSNASDENVAAE